MKTALVVVFVFVNVGICMAQTDRKVDKANSPKNSHKEAAQNDKPMSFWMERKLELSQAVFAALAAGDFEKLERNASQMQVLSKIEGFVRRRSPEYTAHLNSFELSNREIIKHAKEQKLEGAALAFQQLTISCVSCHKLLRDGSAKVEPTDPK